MTLKNLSESLVFKTRPDICLATDYFNKCYRKIL